MSSLCLNSLSDEVTKIESQRAKGSACNKGCWLAGVSPVSDAPQTVGHPAAHRPHPASPPHSPALAMPEILVVASRSARWTGYIGGDAAGVFLLVQDCFVQHNILSTMEGPSHPRERHLVHRYTLSPCTTSYRTHVHAVMPTRKIYQGQ